ncbi:hypothetical protein [Caldimonas tepidiphila]|uniref:hypothetical protein n=1 Tax=Caldimonas tepidiphila TaxID=2315841 RepID=UPI000E5C4B01|nr:hypothetical protein [Caldimonas tepidiphila]
MDFIWKVWRRQPRLGLYLLGHVAILLGAWGTEESGSMLPLALGSSAALMLMVPLLRQLLARFRSRRTQR